MIKKTKIGNLDFRKAGKGDIRYKLIFTDTEGEPYHICMCDKTQIEEVEKDFYYNYLNYNIEETITIMKEKYNNKIRKE